MDPEIGTIYSVAVPVRRVKPALRPPMSEEAAPAGIVSRCMPDSSKRMLFYTFLNISLSGSCFLQWDPNDPDSDPADQFPFGT